MKFDNLESFERILESKEMTESKIPNSIRVTILITVFAFLCVIVIASCFLKVDDYIIVNGKVKLKNSAKQIVLKDDGVLESLHVKDGDFVQKGAVLFELDSSEYQRHLETLSLQKVALQKQIDNYFLLIESIESEKNMFSEFNSQVSIYRNQYRQFEVDLSITMEQYDHSHSDPNLYRDKVKLDKIVSIEAIITQIITDINMIDNQIVEIEQLVKASKYISPCNGVIIIIQDVKQGDFLTAGTSLLQISSDKEYVVESYISEANISKISEQQRTIYLWGSDYTIGEGAMQSVSAVPEIIENNIVYKSISSLNAHDLSLFKLDMELVTKIELKEKSALEWLLKKLNFIE